MSSLTVTPGASLVMDGRQVFFLRQGQHITNVATGEKVDHKSISKAKRWSLNWQKANGFRGDGQLRVKR